MRIEQSFKLYVQDVYRYAFYKLKNEDDAKDCVSETFLRLINNNRFERIEKSKEKLWIIGIARNIIYESYRKEERNFDSIDTYENDLIDKATLEDEVIDKEMIEIVRKKLDLLDDITREVLILKIWEDLKFGEIAQILKTTDSNVKYWYYKGIEDIKSMLEKEKKKKAVVIGFGGIIAAIKIYGNDQIFNVSDSFVAEMSQRLDKILSENNMNIINKLSTRFVQLSIPAKVVTIVATIATVSVVTIGGVSLASNLRVNSIPVPTPSPTILVTETPTPTETVAPTPTPEPTPEVNCFNSNNNTYKITFCHPKEFGTASGRVTVAPNTGLNYYEVKFSGIKDLTLLFNLTNSGSGSDTGGNPPNYVPFGVTTANGVKISNCGSRTGTWQGRGNYRAVLCYWDVRRQSPSYGVKVFKFNWYQFNNQYTAAQMREISTKIISSLNFTIPYTK